MLSAAVEGGWRHHASHTMPIFDIWEQVFLGQKRLVRVRASQVANTSVAQQILSFADASHHTDACPRALLHFRGAGQQRGINP
jgi:hypothetical protein